MIAIKNLIKSILVSLTVVTYCALYPAFAQTNDPAAANTDIYDAAFFTQFKPQSALDIIQQIPGFALDTGDTVRGFGAGAGNVLIDGVRPTSKSGGIEDALLRIPASQVDRVELLRGSAAAGEASGQSVVANIIRRKNTRGTRWQLEIEHAPNGTINPIGEITHTQAVGQWDTSVKLNAFTQKYPREARIRNFDSDGTLRFSEIEDRPSRLTDVFLSGDANRKFGGSTLKINGRFGWSQFKPKTFRERFTARLPDSAADSSFFSVYNSQFYEGELGIDLTKPLKHDWSMRVLGLATHQHWWYTIDSDRENPVGSFTGGSFVDRVQDTYETILRTTFTKTGHKKFRPEFGGEVVYNRVSSAIDFETLDAQRDRTQVPIPASDVTVQERRAELFGNLLWRATERLNIEAGIAAEASEIQVTGDAQNKQNLQYFKPSLSFTYDISGALQMRLSARRSVGQLDFADFASSANVVDDRITTGNPGLRPDKTTRLSSTIDYRFSKRGSVNLEVFHEWKQDVLELILLPDGAQGIGNAGSARLWGYALSATLPLDVALKGALVTLKAEDRSTDFTDPITNTQRRLNALTVPTVTVDFRHDIPDQKIAWGVGYQAAQNQDFYYVDEFDGFRAHALWNAFVESSHIKGIKIRLEANRIGGEETSRERRFYEGSRAGALTGYELTNRNRGTFFSIILSGQF